MEQNDELGDVNEGLNDEKSDDQNDGLCDDDHLGDLGLVEPHIMWWQERLKEPISFSAIEAKYFRTQ